MLIDTHAIANLARISLTEDEHVSFSKDIESILSFIHTIQSLSVSSEKRQSQSEGFAPVGITRLDQEVIRSGQATATEIVEQAPTHEHNFIKVKKILN